MGKVVFDITMSLDGFIAGPDDHPDQPLGKDGLRLHDWLSSDRTEAETELLENSNRTLGAVICGRRTYDNSAKWWGPGQGPAGKTPVVVVSHGVAEEAVGEDSPFTFVGEGIEAALARAQEIAGEQDVCVMGGADVAQQYLAAGLVDEVSVHLVPVLLGAGRRLFDHLGPDHIELRPVEVIDSPTTTHVRYDVVR